MQVSRAMPWPFFFFFSTKIPLTSFLGAFLDLCDTVNWMPQNAPIQTRDSAKPLQHPLERVSLLLIAAPFIKCKSFHALIKTCWEIHKKKALDDLSQPLLVFRTSALSLMSGWPANSSTMKFISYCLTIATSFSVTMRVQDDGICAANLIYNTNSCVF